MGALSSVEGYEPRFERMMDALWQALTAHWGNAFISRFGEDWTAEQTWQSEMRGLTKNQILTGLEECKYDSRFVEWPPAARVFRAIAMKQPMRVGGVGADEVFRNIESYYAKRRPSEAVWILQAADNWEMLRNGTEAARREFDRLWAKMLVFVAEGGELPPPMEPRPQVEYKRSRKPVDWAKLKAALGVDV